MWKNLSPFLFLPAFLVILLSFWLGESVLANSVSDSVVVTQTVIAEDASVFPLREEEQPAIVSDVNYQQIYLNGPAIIINWQTDKPSKTILRYGQIQDQYELGGVSSDDLRTRHQAVLTNVEMATDYNFQIQTTTAHGVQVKSWEHSFKVKPTSFGLIRTVLAIR